MCVNFLYFAVMGANSVSFDLDGNGDNYYLAGDIAVLTVELDDDWEIVSSVWSDTLVVHQSIKKGDNIVGILNSTSVDDVAVSIRIKNSKTESEGILFASSTGYWVKFVSSAWKKVGARSLRLTLDGACGPKPEKASITGPFVKLERKPIHWKSIKRQKTIKKWLKNLPLKYDANLVVHNRAKDSVNIPMP